MQTQHNLKTSSSQILNISQPNMHFPNNHTQTIPEHSSLLKHIFPNSTITITSNQTNNNPTKHVLPIPKHNNNNNNSPFKNGVTNNSNNTSSLLPHLPNPFHPTSHKLYSFLYKPIKLPIPKQKSKEKFNQHIRRCLSSQFDEYNKRMHEILNVRKIIKNQKVNTCIYKYKPCNEDMKNDKYYICDKIRVVPSCKEDFIKIKTGLTKERKDMSEHSSQGDNECEHSLLDKKTFCERIQKGEWSSRNEKCLKGIRNLNSYRVNKNRSMVLSREELKVMNKEGLKNMKVKFYYDFKHEVFNAKNMIVSLKQQMANVLDDGRDNFMNNVVGINKFSNIKN